MERTCIFNLHPSSGGYINMQHAKGSLSRQYGDWKLFRMMKNAFYFTLKALFVLEIFKFLFWLSSFVRKYLKRWISKFMTSQTGWLTKEVWNETSYLILFMIFEEKCNSSTSYSINLLNFSVWLALNFEISDNRFVIQFVTSYIL